MVQKPGVPLNTLSTEGIPHIGDVGCQKDRGAYKGLVFRLAKKGVFKTALTLASP